MPPSLPSQDSKPYSIGIKYVCRSKGAEEVLARLSENVNRRHKKRVHAWLCSCCSHSAVCPAEWSCPDIHVTPAGYSNRRPWTQALGPIPRKADGQHGPEVDSAWQAQDKEKFAPISRTKTGKAGTTREQQRTQFAPTGQASTTSAEVFAHPYGEVHHGVSHMPGFTVPLRQAGAGESQHVAVKDADFSNRLPTDVSQAYGASNSPAGAFGQGNQTFGLGSGTYELDNNLISQHGLGPGDSGVPQQQRWMDQINNLGQMAEQNNAFGNASQSSMRWNQPQSAAPNGGDWVQNLVTSGFTSQQAQSQAQAPVWPNQLAAFVMPQVFGQAPNQRADTVQPSPTTQKQPGTGSTAAPEGGNNILNVLTSLNVISTLNQIASTLTDPTQLLLVNHLVNQISTQITGQQQAQNTPNQLVQQLLASLLSPGRMPNSTASVPVSTTSSDNHLAQLANLASVLNPNAATTPASSAPGGDNHSPNQLAQLANLASILNTNSAPSPPSTTATADTQSPNQLAQLANLVSLLNPGATSVSVSGAPILDMQTISQANLKSSLNRDTLDGISSTPAPSAWDKTPVSQLDLSIQSQQPASPLDFTSAIQSSLLDVVGGSQLSGSLQPGNPIGPPRSSQSPEQPVCLSQPAQFAISGFAPAVESWDATTLSTSLAEAVLEGPTQEDGPTSEV